MTFYIVLGIKLQITVLARIISPSFHGSVTSFFDTKLALCGQEKSTHINGHKRRYFEEMLVDRSMLVDS